MNDKSVIQKNFSRFANHYQSYSDVQNRSAQNLIELTLPCPPQTILDIGCGPGNYTAMLNKKFPAADITAFDISQEMIDAAKARLSEQNINFLTADADTLDLSKKFDLITSNATFQWLNDLSSALKKYKNMLTENGYILFSIFGPETFTELNESLADFYKSYFALTSLSFMSQQTLEKQLAQTFGDFNIEEEIIRKDYPSLWKLLKAIKYTGTRGSGLGGETLTKAKIAELEKIYKNKFGSIRVTYQVFYCRAERTGQ